MKQSLQINSGGNLEIDLQPFFELSEINRIVKNSDRQGQTPGKKLISLSEKKQNNEKGGPGNQKVFPCSRPQNGSIWVRGGPPIHPLVKKKVDNTLVCRKKSRNNKNKPNVITVSVWNHSYFFFLVGPSIGLFISVVPAPPAPAPHVGVSAASPVCSAAVVRLGSNWSILAACTAGSLLQSYRGCEPPPIETPVSLCPVPRTGSQQT